MIIMTKTKNQIQLQKDIQTISFNMGQMCLIDNILSEEFENVDELFMFIRVWKSKLDKDIEKMHLRYEAQN